MCFGGVQKSRRWKGKREGSDYSNRPIKLAGKVIIQEISCLLPVHKALGETYVYVLFSDTNTLLFQIISLPCSHTQSRRFQILSMCSHLCLFHFFLRLNVNDIQDTCQKNGAAALAVGRRDLAKVILYTLLYCRVSAGKEESSSSSDIYECTCVKYYPVT